MVFDGKCCAMQLEIYMNMVMIYFWLPTRTANDLLNCCHPPRDSQNNVTPTLSPKTEYENVAAVVAALDKHTLSNGRKPYYVLIDAYDGMKYDVDPGDYLLEIYLYNDLEKISEVALNTQEVENQVCIDANVMLLLHTTNKDDLDSLVADLHDGQFDLRKEPPPLAHEALLTITTI
ncbi:hypothetical protein ACFLWZ_06725 [Chloroflexota bacterium]